ncbi:MAG: entericidin A/B family lipoprotein [Alphaproteobacteria bacterium]
MTRLATFALWLLLSAAAFAAAACDHTIRGVGQDLEDTGEAIDDAVN